MEANQILEKLALLEAQYAASICDHTGDPARWAIVNAILALALKFKTAYGSEKALESFPHSFYQNALAVIPGLILRRPNLLAVQVLQAMAVYAQRIRDHQAFSVLASNASHILKLSRSTGVLYSSSHLELADTDVNQYGNAQVTSLALDKAARQEYNLQNFRQ